MKARRWSDAWMSGAGCRAQPTRSVVALILMAAAFPAGVHGQTAEEETAAVLKLHDVDFFYRSTAAVLSCSELEGRVASIMRALGARDDIRVDVDGCNAVVGMEEPDITVRQDPSDRWRYSSSDPWQTSRDRFRSPGARREQSAHVRVRMMIPVEVTQEVLEEIKRDKSRRELVSRVTGNPAASLEDPIVFPAQRQLVTLSRKTIDLEPEECELLEQMSTSIFRELDMRVVRRSARCDRNEVSRIPPQLTVEALMPVMPNTPQIQLSPQEGRTDSNPGAPAGSQSEQSEPAPASPER